MEVNENYNQRGGKLFTVTEHVAQASFQYMKQQIQLN